MVQIYVFDQSKTKAQRKASAPGAVDDVSRPDPGTGVAPLGYRCLISTSRRFWSWKRHAWSKADDAGRLLVAVG